jgi:hypothetical protein
MDTLEPARGYLNDRVRMMRCGQAHHAAHRRDEPRRTKVGDNMDVDSTMHKQRCDSSADRNCIVAHMIREGVIMSCREIPVVCRW